MAEKDTKRTLAEQQRRQRELIELKRLQQEGGEIPKEHDGTAEAQTPSSKIKNFWYYYKWYVIAFAIIIAALVLLVKQCTEKVVYDYIILLNSTEYVSDSDIAIIESEFKKLATDTNGDGEVNLFLMNCSRNTSASGNIDFNNTQATKFQTQLLDGRARIFIMSKDLFEDSNQEDYMLWTDEFALPDYDGKGLAIADTELGSVLEPYENEYFIGYRKSDSYDTSDAKLFEKFIQECAN